MTFADFSYPVYLDPLVNLLRTSLKLFCFPIFWLWAYLTFQKRVVRTKFDIYVFIRKYIKTDPCYTVKQVLRYLYHATFCIMILVSLHTKSSSMFHAEFFYKFFPPKRRNLTMKTLSYKLRRLSICSFDQIASLLFSPFQSCFIYHVLTMCFYLLMML